MRVSLTLIVTLCAIIAPALSLFCGKDNCYEILGIPRNSTKSDVRRAYRRLSAAAHPDKHPNDATALERFRKLGAAYEALSNDAKRAQYEDFLDNPGKYWDYLIRNAQENYAPKSNTILVVLGLIGLINVLHWLHMNHSYHDTLRRMKETQDFKREVTRLLKSKQAATREEAEAMINLDVVGLKEPHWKNLVFFKMLEIPRELAKLASWKAKWIINYRIRKLEYSDEDKKYLIQKNLTLNDQDMKKIPPKEYESYLTKEFWKKENAEEFLRMKRIELNRLGKGKKKKKHTPIPYSEAEDVSMD